MHHLLDTRAPEHRWDAGLLLGLAAVPICLGLALAPGAARASDIALTATAAAGALFLVAAILLYLEWQLAPTPQKGWLVAAVLLLGCQLLGSAAMTLDPLAAAQRGLGWPLVVDLVVTGAVVIMADLCLERRPPCSPDPLVTGLALGLLGTAAKPLLLPVGGVPPLAPSIVLGTTVLAYAVLAAAVVARHSLSSWLAWRLALTLVLVSTAHVAASPLVPGAVLDLTVGTLVACAGVLWASTAFTVLRTALDDEHQHLVEVESSLLAMEGTHRGAKEALHELKSTISGLAKASELLGDPDLAPDSRRRLERSLLHELGRMERLLWMSCTPPRVVDLDLTIDALLAVHRVQGRRFAWTPTSTDVVGSQDAVAEAMNILLDNAAKHGDATTGRVDVRVDDTDEGMVCISVSDDGPGVPPEMRQRIFEWGERGPGSSGQGIGLNLARRLVGEQGGSLTLAEAEVGSSFVIRLPAARRSEEINDASTQRAAG